MNLLLDDKMGAGPLILGAHAIIYSRKPAADRAFLRDILGLSHVDAGKGWLIFRLPPAEMAAHPALRTVSASSISCVPTSKLRARVEGAVRVV